MLKAKIKENKIKVFFEIAELIAGADIKLKGRKNDFEASMVDPAMVVMAELKLNKKAFEEYSCDDMDLGIDLNKMMPILKLASSGQIIEFEYNDKQDKEHLIIRIENLTRKLRLIDPSDIKDTKFPALQLPGVIGIKTNELTKGVKAAAAISDHFKLTATKEYFELFAEGDTDEVSLKLPKDLLTELKTDKTYSSMFGIDYFQSLIKYAPEDLKLSLGNDNPVKIEYSFAEESGIFTSMQAPRIEADK